MDRVTANSEEGGKELYFYNVAAPSLEGFFILIDVRSGLFPCGCRRPGRQDGDRGLWYQTLCTLYHRGTAMAGRLSPYCAGPGCPSSAEQK